MLPLCFRRGNAAGGAWAKWLISPEAPRGFEPGIRRSSPTLYRRRMRSTGWRAASGRIGAASPTLIVPWGYGLADHRAGTGATPLPAPGLRPRCGGQPEGRHRSSSYNHRQPTPTKPNGTSVKLRVGSQAHQRGAANYHGALRTTGYHRAQWYNRERPGFANREPASGIQPSRLSEQQLDKPPGQGHRGKSDSATSFIALLRMDRCSGWSQGRE